MELEKSRGLHHGERVEREPIYIRGSGALNISRRQAPGSPQFQHWPNHVVLLFLAQNISSSIPNLRWNFQLQCLKLRNFLNSFVNSLFAFYLRIVRRAVRCWECRVRMCCCSDAAGLHQPEHTFVFIFWWCTQCKLCHCSLAGCLNILHDLYRTKYRRMSY